MKQKTRSSAKKRFRVTGTGKIKTMKAGRKHLLQQKSIKQRKLGNRGKAYLLHKSFEYEVKRMLPYL